MSVLTKSFCSISCLSFVDLFSYALSSMIKLRHGKSIRRTLREVLGVCDRLTYKSDAGASSELFAFRTGPGRCAYRVAALFPPDFLCSDDWKARHDGRRRRCPGSPFHLFFSPIQAEQDERCKSLSMNSLNTK